jgi:hypothetical protein
MAAMTVSVRRMHRRAGALVGIFAVLIQAILFGWHHHAPLTASAGIVATAPTSPTLPHLVDDDCPICFTLSHHGVVPLDFSVPHLPEAGPTSRAAPPAVDAPLARYYSFQSRAPPSA